MSKVPVVVHYNVESGFPDCYIHRDPVILWVSENNDSEFIHRELARIEGRDPFSIRIKNIQFK